MHRCASASAGLALALGLAWALAWPGLAMPVSHGRSEGIAVSSAGVPECELPNAMRREVSAQRGVCVFLACNQAVPAYMRSPCLVFSEQQAASRMGGKRSNSGMAKAWAIWQGNLTDLDMELGSWALCSGKGSSDGGRESSVSRHVRVIPEREPGWGAAKQIQENADEFGWDTNTMPSKQIPQDEPSPSSPPGHWGRRASPPSPPSRQLPW
jgi:hypothetical protein